MAKNFSVEWLSQSYHTQQLDEETHAFYNVLDSKASPTAFHLSRGGDCGKRETLPSSPSNSCGYTSASESDVGDDSEGESGPNRRVRTKFTSDQISRLEKTFNKHKYLGATQRRKIAEKLNLSETQVKTWFQNRRMKLKREVQDMRTAQYFVPTLLRPLTSFQHHVMSEQRRPRQTFIHQQHVQRIPVHPLMFTSCFY